MGRIIIGAPHIAEMLDFNTNVLGFRVSDYWRPDDRDVVFLRCNARHHSLALVPADEAALYHFMLEAATLDDVGAALQRHHDAGMPISMDLGKHTNDEVVSFLQHVTVGLRRGVRLRGPADRRIDLGGWRDHRTQPVGTRAPQPTS